MEKVIIAKLEPYVGDDTMLNLGGSREMYVIVSIESGETLDYGYRSFNEAVESWPEAENASNINL